MPKRQRSDEEEQISADASLLGDDEENDRKPAAKTAQDDDDDEKHENTLAPAATTSLSSSTAKMQSPPQKVQPDMSSDSPLDRVTPHMERLLRLVQEGTTESAQMAAGQLTQLTQQSAPTVLWQVLGRLQAMLFGMDSWKARQNAALAMEGVAGNLPLTDQHAFFRNNHAGDDEQKNKDNKDNEILLHGNTTNRTTTLRIADISVSMLLQQGQELYAAAPSKYVQQQNEAQEIALEQLDEGSSDFVQERIKKQRRILAQRLGLGAVSDALRMQGKSNELVSGDFVSNEDIVATYRPNIKGRKRPRSEKKEKDIGIQHLLVQEIKKVSQDWWQ